MHRRSYKGRKLGRKTGPRKALLRSLATNVILYEKIKTTKAKAKDIKPDANELITLAKKADLASKRRLFSYLLDEKAVLKLESELVPIYKERNGGYTRITAVGARAGDGAEEAMLELIDTEKILKKEAKPQKEEKEKKSPEKSKEVKSKEKISSQKEKAKVK
ncbi:MAG: 50S ribosomal protein L17 [Patescibacteria group bacterium]|nr:50S ribosomal protein L17 [Patescibacteria group bacterium]